MEKSFIKIDNWNRKEHFKFFKDFPVPFFEVNIDEDCLFQKFMNEKS